MSQGTVATLDGTQDTTYNLFNMDIPRVNTDGDKVTYQQIMDVMNMVVINTLSAVAPGTNVEYDTAILNSQSLGNTFLSVGILEISTMSLRSSVIDTDLAEASLRLSQLTLNYQAMLSTVGRVSQLSLVNYL